MSIEETFRQMRAINERVIKLDRLYMAWDRAIRGDDVELLNKAREDYLSFRDDRKSIEDCGMDYDEHVKTITNAGGLIYEVAQ